MEKEEMKELYDAAMLGDVEFLQRQAETQNEEIFLRKTAEGDNLIHIATQYEKLEFIESCLEKSYPKYCKPLLCEGNSIGDTPLHVAARAGNFGIVQLLYGWLEKTKVGEEKPWLVQNLFGDTAVHKALSHNQLKIARFLLDIDLDFAFVRNKSKEAPLHVAIDTYLYHYKSVPTMMKREQLLKKRAKSTIIKSANDEVNMISLIVFLVETASSVATLPNISGLTPLHRAASLNSPYNILVPQLIIEHCTQSPEVCDKHDENSDKAMGSGEEEDDEGWENMLVNVAMNGDVCVFDDEYNYILRDEKIFRKSYAEDNMIHIAVLYENQEFIEKYMEKYMEKNKKQIREKNRQGNSPLHVAAEVGNLNMVRLLYDYLKKSSVEGEERPWRAQNSQGNTPVHVALQYHNFDVAMFLIDQDRGFARVVNGSKEAPLHLAIMAKRAELEVTGKLLHAARCVATWPNTEGLTPLHIAASFGQFSVQVIDLIIKHCPESSQVFDASGKSILHHLAENEFDNVNVKRALSIPQLFFLKNHQDHEGNTPLHIAAKCQNVCMVKQLIDSSAKEYICNRDGIRALSSTQRQYFQRPLVASNMKTWHSDYASGGGQSVQMLSFLMKSEGIDFLGSRDSEERNFLHLVTNIVGDSNYKRSEFDDLKEFVEEALEMCPQLICQTDKRGDTPLHVLARNTWLSDIMSSWQPGLLPNLLSKTSSTIKHNNEDDYNRWPWLVQNGEGNTPLHEAIIAQNKFLVFELLSYSEETARLVNKHKETPLHLLAGTTNNSLTDFVSERITNLVNASSEALEMLDMDGLTPVSRALTAENLYMVDTLLSKVKKFGDLHGETFWDLFLNHQSNEFVNKLLENQTFRKMLEHKDKHGNAPLHLVMKDINNKLDMATIICSKVPEAVKLGDIHGCTFWHLLPRHPSSGNLKDKVQGILRNEVSRKGLEQKDKDGNTPLHLAIKEKHFDFVELLAWESELETSELDRLLTITNNAGDTPEDLLADSPTLPKEFERRILTDRRMKGIRSSWGIPRTQLQNYMSSMNVIAALQTTITFTAAFTVPGGLNQDNGTPLLMQSMAFHAFMISNVIAMCLSMLVLICLLWMVATKKRESVMIQDFAFWLLLASFVATLLAFMTGVYATISPVKPWIAIFTLVLCSFLVLLFPRNILTKLLLFKYRKHRCVKIKCWRPNDDSNT